MDNKNRYNEYIQEQNIPKVLVPFVSKKINLMIDGEVIGIELSNGLLVDIRQKGLEKPAMEITTTSAFIEKLLASYNPIGSIVEGLASGEIVKKDIGVVNKIMGMIFNLTLKLLSLFR